MDMHLSPEQRAVAGLFQRMLEHHLYWLILVKRWIHDNGQFMWALLPLRQFPWWKRVFMRQSIQSVVAKMEATLGRRRGGHKARQKQADVDRAVLEDIGTVEIFLRNKSYLMGERVCYADCAVFAFLVVSRDAWKIEHPERQQQQM